MSDICTNNVTIAPNSLFQELVGVRLFVESTIHKWLACWRKRNARITEKEIHAETTTTTPLLEWKYHARLAMQHHTWPSKPRNAEDLRPEIDNWQILPSRIYDAVQVLLLWYTGTIRLSWTPPRNWQNRKSRLEDDPYRLSACLEHETATWTWNVTSRDSEKNTNSWITHIGCYRAISEPYLNVTGWNNPFSRLQTVI